MTPAPHPRLLVTGGRGRLAALVADHRRTAGADAVLYSRESGGGREPLTDLLRSGALTPHDTILHLAWSTLPATAEAQPGLAETQDFPLLRNLLAAAAVARPHFVFFSSGGTVYGNAPGRPSRESDPCRPIGAYGRAKLAAEEMISQAAAAHGLPCTILRISNPYGFPVPSGRAQGVIPHAIRCALAGQPFTLWGDGHARKDFLHCTDFLAALDLVIARRLTGVFNLAAGESHSVREILATVEALTARPIATTRTPAPSWDVQDSRLDPGRFREATGWQPRISLAEGIRRAIQSHHEP